jgi:hypothetical protein
VAYNLELEKSELEFFKSQGMKFIEMPKAETDKFLKIAYETLTQVVMEKAPVEGKKIQEYLQKKP